MSFIFSDMRHGLTSVNAMSQLCENVISISDSADSNRTVSGDFPPRSCKKISFMIVAMFAKIANVDPEKSMKLLNALPKLDIADPGA